MGDTFWMEDKVRVEWEEAARDFEDIFKKPHKPAPINSLPFVNSQIQDYILQKAQYPVTNTGSYILDALWKQKIGKFKFEPTTKIEVLISLN